MQSRRRAPLLALALAALLGACQDGPTGITPQESALTNRGQGKKSPEQPPSEALVVLGKHLFEDEDLSVGRNQSCQTCHEPSEGFAAALPGVTTRGSVVQGSVIGRFGERKPPSAAYAMMSPNFSGGNNPTGGNFWDGNATGEILGSAAADQAMGPFLNPVEQGLPDRACVAYRVRLSSYLGRYTAVWGHEIESIVFPGSTETICTDPNLTLGEHVGLTVADRAKADSVFHNVARAVAAFEGSDHVSKFNSRYDFDELSDVERWGEKLFDTKGKCQQCHNHKGQRPAFSDFAFHNLGVPKNPENPVFHYGNQLYDPGLGGFTGQARHLGKFRTPTLRNVAKGTGRTYMHNGALISLEQVVDFYSTRDALPLCTLPAQLADPTRWGSTAFGGDGCWPPPEFGQNLDTKNMGKLGLTPDEVRAIAAYLRAIDDR
jgi:cytochrome c peroxidase